MSSAVTNPSDNKNSTSGNNDIKASPTGKGKSKAVEGNTEETEEEEEDDEDEDMGSDEEEEAEEVEEEFDEIDPSVILPSGRRTRGVKVDYTSQEALAKAGLNANEENADDSDDDVEMKN